MNTAPCDRFDDDRGGEVFCALCGVEWYLHEAPCSFDELSSPPTHCDACGRTREQHEARDQLAAAAEARSRGPLVNDQP